MVYFVFQAEKSKKIDSARSSLEKLKACAKYNDSSLKVI